VIVIKKYEENPVTGFVDVIINNGIDDKKISFTCRQNADVCIRKIKKDFITNSFTTWVNHKKILHERGDRSFYSSHNRCQSLYFCLNIIYQLREMPLYQACKTVIEYEKHLRNILPAPSNNSYENQRNKLTDLIVFARQELASVQNRILQVT